MDVRQLLGPRFGELAGAHLSGEVPLGERLLNRLVADALARIRDYDFPVSLNDVTRVYFERSAMHAKEAMTADPNLGMARALYAWANPPALSAAQREQELNRAVADAGDRSVHAHWTGSHCGNQMSSTAWKTALASTALGQDRINRR